MFFIFDCAPQAFLQFQPAGAILQLQCVGFSSLQWLLLLQTMGSRVSRLQQLPHVDSAVTAPGLQGTGSVVAQEFSRCMACGIFLAQGSNPCLLNWQVDSSPLSHQESPWFSFIRFINMFLEFIHFPLVFEFVGI